MAKRLFQEFFEIHDADIQLFAEADQKSKGALGTFKGIAHRVGRITQNNTLYRRSLMHREVERIQPLIKVGKITGLADHPFYGGNEVLTLAVRWTDAKIDAANDLRVAGVLLKTSAGQQVAAAREGGVVFGLSMRGWGNAHKEKMGPDHPEWDLNREREGDEFWDIDDDYSMGTPADIVLNPSSEGSWETESVKQALARLEAAASHTHDREGDDLMEIKTLEDLKTAAPAEVLDAFKAEALAGHVTEADRDAAVEAAKVEGAKVIKDTAKLAEAAGVSEVALTWVKDNAAKIEVYAETHTPLGEKPKPAPAGDSKALQEQIASLSEQIVQANDARIALEKQIKAERTQAKLTELINECVKGEAKAALLADQVAEHHTVSEGFDPSKPETVQTEKDKILAVVKARKEYLAAHGVNFEDARPDGKGHQVDSGGADAMAAKREAFDKAHPDFAVSYSENLDVVRGAVIQEKDPTLTAEWMTVYGPSALKALPLGK